MVVYYLLILLPLGRLIPVVDMSGALSHILLVISLILEVTGVDN